MRGMRLRGEGDWLAHPLAVTIELSAAGRAGTPDEVGAAGFAVGTSGTNTACPSGVPLRDRRPGGAPRAPASGGG